MKNEDLVKLKEFLLMAFKAAQKSGDATALRAYSKAYDQAAVDLIRMRNTKK